MPRFSELGHYTVLGQIGSGGMGEVYTAEDTRLRRRVALKVLPPEWSESHERRARFKREAEAVAALDHPNIVTLYSVEEEQGVHFFTMQLVQGRTLDEVIPTDGLPIATFLELALPLAEAIAAAHAKGVTHRDLKPANVMVSESGRVVVLDFGLAKLQHSAFAADAPPEEVSRETTAAELTDEGRVIGTVSYMSPEQVEGRPVGPRSDVFSLGILFHEMLTGWTPFTGSNRISIMSAVLKDEPRSLREVREDVPAEIEGLVKRCLSKDPDARFQTAAELLAELKLLKPSEPVVGARTAGTRSPGLLRRLGVAALGLSALTAVAIGVTRVAFERPAAAGLHWVVALPTEVASSDPRLPPLADAVPAALTRSLSGIEGLEVRMPPVDPAAGEGTERGGGASIHSTALPMGPDRFALSVHVVDDRTRSLLWSAEYENRFDDHTETVRRAGEGVRRALVAAVHGGDTGAAEGETADLREAMFYASRYENLGESRDFETARAAFERARRRHPESAEVAAGMATLLLLHARTGEAEALQEAERAARDAALLDPDSGTARGVRALLGALREDGRSEGLAMALRGAALDGRNPRAQAYLGMLLDRTGYSSSLAIESFREAARLDPLFLSPRLSEARILLGLRRTTEARLLVDEVLRLEPRAPAGLVLQRQIGSSPGVTAVDADLGAAHHAMLDTVAALEEGDDDALGALVARARITVVDPRVSPLVKQGLVPVALELARGRSHRHALDLLEILASADILVAYDTLMVSPIFEPLRDEPSFVALTARSRDRFREMVVGIDEARARAEVPHFVEETLSLLEARIGDVR